MKTLSFMETPYGKTTIPYGQLGCTVKGYWELGKDSVEGCVLDTIHEILIGNFNPKGLNITIWFDNDDMLNAIDKLKTDYAYDEEIINILKSELSNYDSDTSWVIEFIH